MDNILRAKRIKLIILDVDGVLTDGKLIFGSLGEEHKHFHVHDGLGISIAQKLGIKTAIITGRESEMVTRRGADLKITHIYQGAMEKLDAYEELLAKYNLTPEEVCYIGDDLIDLPVMTRVGFACAPANGAIDVKNNAHFIAKNCGGNGAVREIIEYILKAQEKWANIVQDYLTHGKITNIKQ